LTEQQHTSKPQTKANISGIPNFKIAMEFLWISINGLIKDGTIQTER